MRSIRAACCIVPLLTTALQAQTLVPAGTGLSIALTGVTALTTTDIAGPSRTDLDLAPRIEAAFATSPRLAVLAASHRRQIEVDGIAFVVRSLELGVRYTGRPGTPLRPFAEAGMARRNFRYNTAALVTAEKMGPWVGVGGQWRPRGHWAAEAAVDFGTVVFDRFRADGIARELRNVSTRLTGVRIGGRYWLNAR